MCNVRPIPSVTPVVLRSSWQLWNVGKADPSSGWVHIWPSVHQSLQVREQILQRLYVYSVEHFFFSYLMEPMAFNGHLFQSNLAIAQATVHYFNSPSHQKFTRRAMSQLPAGIFANIHIHILKSTYETWPQTWSSSESTAARSIFSLSSSRNAGTARPCA